MLTKILITYKVLCINFSLGEHLQLKINYHAKFQVFSPSSITKITILEHILSLYSFPFPFFSFFRSCFVARIYVFEINYKNFQIFCFVSYFSLHPPFKFRIVYKSFFRNSYILKVITKLEFMVLTPTVSQKSQFQKAFCSYTILYFEIFEILFCSSNCFTSNGRVEFHISVLNN